MCWPAIQNIPGYKASLQLKAVLLVIIYVLGKSYLILFFFLLFSMLCNLIGGEKVLLSEPELTPQTCLQNIPLSQTSESNNLLHLCHTFT